MLVEVSMHREKSWSVDARLVVIGWMTRFFGLRDLVHKGADSPPAASAPSTAALTELQALLDQAGGFVKAGLYEQAQDARNYALST